MRRGLGVRTRMLGLLASLPSTSESVEYGESRIEEPQVDIEAWLKILSTELRKLEDMEELFALCPCCVIVAGLVAISAKEI